VIVDVADNGQGIPKSNLARIFDPFYTTKPVGRGTGLGLSICYGIVKKMGGEISVNSAVGLGTTFHVHIPRADNVVH
jgi:two-component system NtrC family sensor kinase